MNESMISGLAGRRATAVSATLHHHPPGSHSRARYRSRSGNTRKFLGLCCVVLLYARYASCDAQPPVAHDSDLALRQFAPIRSVLIAGDGSLMVFDNAVVMMSARLSAQGRDELAAIQRLSASKSEIGQHHTRSATLAHVLAAVAAMAPAPGQGCFVFATSHGVQDAGLYLARRDEVLTPEMLDRALLQGCGAAPTAIVISSCFSGGFARPPMTRANRIILTASRADRTSFGCQAGRDYTVYDRCLLDSFGRGGTWKQAYAATSACVSAEEQRDGVTPSEPQAWFGPAVADMALPMSTGP